MSDLNNINREKDELGHYLLDSVKNCQIRFGGKSEIATEFDRSVEKLCYDWENVLSHGIKDGFPEDRNIQNSDLFNVGHAVSQSLRQKLIGSTKPTFWHVVLEILSKDEIERFLSLKSVSTDIGYGRAWLRSALNEHSLERYMYMIVNDCDLLTLFYEPWSFLLDDEKSSILPITAAGTQSILFAINIDVALLNECDINLLYLTEDTLAPVVNCSAPSRPERKKKRPHKQVIDFEEVCNKSIDTVPSKSDDFLSSSSVTTDVSVSPQYLSDHARATINPTGSFTNLSLLSNDSENFDNNFTNSKLAQMNSPATDNVLTPLNDSHVSHLIPVVLPSICSDASIYDDDSFDKDSTLNYVDCTAYEPNEEDLNTTILKAGEEKKVEHEQRTTAILLQDERDRSSSLYQELKELQVKHEEESDRLKSKFEEIQKENSALKEQVKQYVDAIKMMKQPDDWKSDIMKKIDQLGGSSKDYYKEALQFEEKLIKVVEMHGELLEFNDKLQKQLNQKEILVAQLRKELISLRGPMPNQLELDEMTASIENPIGVYKYLINIWIPSAFLTGKGRDVHHVYQIFIRIKDQEWNVYRRYSIFYELNRQVKKIHGMTASFDFPPKKTIGSKDSNLVDERRKRLQTYMRKIINFLMNTYILCPSLDSKDNLLAIFPFLCEDLIEDRRAVLVLPDKKIESGRSSIPKLPDHQYTGL